MTVGREHDPRITVIQRELTVRAPADDELTVSQLEVVLLVTEAVFHAPS